jgi:hypothetical protein
MHKFYSSKYPEEKGANEPTPTSEEIFSVAAG